MKEGNDPTMNTTLELRNTLETRSIPARNAIAHSRSRLPLSRTAGVARTSAARDYLRSLRAAEMAAWEMTGGDVLLARFATRCNGMPLNIPGR